MTDEEKSKILNKEVEKSLYFRLDDYKYSNTSKERVSLSGVV